VPAGQILTRAPLGSNRLLRKVSHEGLVKLNLGANHVVSTDENQRRDNDMKSVDPRLMVEKIKETQGDGLMI